jgi:hypothetical protein
MTAHATFRDRDGGSGAGAGASGAHGFDPDSGRTFADSRGPGRLPSVVIM